MTDPGNLGAILRSAECAGVTGAILPRHRAVHVTPAATKAAAGAVEHLPMAVVGGLPAAIADLRRAGVHVVGLDGAADTSLYDLAGADGPVCLVLGAEGRGLSRLVRERCDEVVAIPMRGRARLAQRVGGRRPGLLRDRPPPVSTARRRARGGVRTRDLTLTRRLLWPAELLGPGPRP